MIVNVPARQVSTGPLQERAQHWFLVWLCLLYAPHDTCCAQEMSQQATPLVKSEMCCCVVVVVVVVVIVVVVYSLCCVVM